MSEVRTINETLAVAGVKQTNIKAIAPQADGEGYVRELQFFDSTSSGARPMLTVRIEGESQGDLEITVPEHDF